LAHFSGVYPPIASLMACSGVMCLIQAACHDIAQIAAKVCLGREQK
jgi:hypothetical protein